MHYSRYPQFSQNIYTYTLSDITYLGEPSDNIIPNYHDTFTTSITVEKEKNKG